MKSSDRLVEYLEGAIIEGSLRNGERLPPERELAREFAMSRTAVREVLQQLKAKQWITSRQGGGHYVSGQLHQDIADPILKILECNENGQADLLEFRYSLEGDCAYNAAVRANEVDLQFLAKAYHRLEQAYKQNDTLAEAEADAGFHLAVAEASHNLIHMHLVKSLFTVLRTTMETYIELMFLSETTSKHILQQHWAIYDAIATRRPEAARAAAHKHIQYVEQLSDEFDRHSMRLERSQRRYLAQHIESPFFYDRYSPYPGFPSL